MFGKDNMSRIGKQPVVIPSGVTVELHGIKIKVKGPEGELNMAIPDAVNVKQEDNTLVVSMKNNSKRSREQWGLARALLSNLVTGVSKKFEKRLILKGVGYRFNVGPTSATFTLGYSHQINLQYPAGVVLEIDKDNKELIIVKGVSKEYVGQFAAKIKGLRPVEPYKGKGFRYEGQHVIKKAGKTAASKSS